MGILDFLRGSTINTTSFSQLHRKIVNLRSGNLYYFPYNLPQAIQFPSDFWKDLINIYRKTNTDGLERAFSVFWADGEVVLTEVNTGSNRMVKSGGSIQVKYSHHPTRKGYARKELYLDNSLLKRKDIFFKDVPKSLEVQYLFNIHTHPKHTKENQEIYYNFFSAQDINSLLSSKAIITGLVTDKLWLLIRTTETPSEIVNLTDTKVTPAYVEGTLHMGLYRADFNKKAYRYNLIKT
ncbi:MAG: hypothetical protein UR34_C0018G0005 [candidate division WS6 bacterium GW2011_GWC1_33_20]|uniref:Uncharacterized protein n=2 Tax=Candidatus Dojkabacteria TaxID=74243 RepID=A0A0G0CT56_9BACT|nr:MAG: hypothetical protein UR34_C0018G0005 [candidate division WS6 bacterium GW2011_GWC1_33_20]KKP45603.1 MAG: hypothetical protein UR36_C0007G0018 [candidate division WS6 bacterium GW2011_GWF1_33_233]KKP54345.1 MAG: hypothetical protein UR47_C0020G0006 [candidate division WS6 bacterium GW2011_GWB1_33_6]KKP55708.1 MAG: hypothetical protein UR49_C0033G0007 [candidate division WS6 bacterium GW2011_GWF2_33_92]KKP82157.1 MAG: hypothetical protein UR84_C0007G0018 [candidate division WS6 bacterium 